jgi:hypothetical protein
LFLFPNSTSLRSSRFRARTASFSSAPSALDALFSLTKAINASLGWHRHPRNGKVARLPEPVRNRINLMLQDNLPYRDIIANLQDAGCLPYPINVKVLPVPGWLATSMLPPWLPPYSPSALAAHPATANRLGFPLGLV